MSTFGGPYRENEPKPEYKEPFWWKVKLGAAGEPSPKECRDELHAVRPIGKTECSKPNHISKQVERGKDLYLECKCPR